MYIETEKTFPLVSVIMPAYNAAPFLEEAISSVISQTISEWELFVIDDCSSDDTFRIACALADKDSRIHVLRNDVNSGVAKTRNRGIDMAKGQYIAFLDSDDRWHPEKLEQQIDVSRQTDAGIVYCSYAIIDANGSKCRADYMVPAQVSLKDLLKENCIQCSAMLIRAEILKGIKFNTEYYHEDYILGLDILKSGQSAAGCTNVLLDWRYIANSRSFDKKKSAKNRWIIYRNYLKLPLAQCMWLFCCYTAAGLRKYLNKN